MIGPVEALGRIAAATEERRFPRGVGGDAGHAVRLALIADRIDGVGRAGGQHQRDFVLGYQLSRDFGGAAGVGLRIAHQNFDWVFRAGDGEPLTNGLPDAVENERVRRAEVVDGAGLGADEADLDGARGAGRGSDQRGRGKAQSGEALNGAAASDWRARQRVRWSFSLWLLPLPFPPARFVDERGRNSECLDERQFPSSPGRLASRGEFRMMCMVFITSCGR